MDDQRSAADEEHVHDAGCVAPQSLDRRQVLQRAMYVAAGVGAGMAVASCAGTNSAAPPASAQSGGTSGTGGGSGTTASPGVTTKRPDTPAEAFESLKAGNERFATGAPIHPNQSVELRQSFAETQTPFAGFLTCADSRVIPEIIFDQGISDLFVVRVAGNIAAPADVSSLVYAVEVLGVDVISVMGHSNCGAVKAAIDVSNGKMQAGEFAPLIDAIKPAVDIAKPTSNTGEQLQKTIDANAKYQAEALAKASPALTAAVNAGKLTIVPSVYDLQTGRVRILG